MEFEYNKDKDQVNREKHGVSFEDAKAIWQAAHVEIEGLAKSDDGEDRNATLGWIGQKLYVAIWTNRNEKIRLISVRRARASEEKIFSIKIQNSR